MPPNLNAGDDSYSDWKPPTNSRLDLGEHLPLVQLESTVSKHYAALWPDVLEQTQFGPPSSWTLVAWQRPVELKQLSPEVGGVFNKTTLLLTGLSHIVVKW